MSCLGNTGVVSGYPTRSSVAEKCPQERGLLGDAVGGKPGSALEDLPWSGRNEEQPRPLDALHRA